MIRKLFQRLFGWPCDHDWEQVGQSNVYDSDTSKRPYCTILIHRCKKCGKSKRISWP